MRPCRSEQRRLVGTLLVPGVLLVAGAAIGYAFTLDVRVAQERLIGLIVAAVAAPLAGQAMLRLSRTTPVLVAAAVMAGVAGLWVIAATGPDVFRGTVGSLLSAVFRPSFGLVRLTDPVEIANTRFIVGYNGLADLCLIAIFACGLMALGMRGWAQRASVVGAAAALVVLVGTGSRGGLIGLVAGICAIGVFSWPRRYALGTALLAPVAAVVVAVGALDKGLEFSSTAGRLAYWIDLARLLVEYPLTGVGLGVDTANLVALQYQINPDPERIFYAHNTFVQAYLEQGPLGFLGMVLVPIIGVTAALFGRRYGVVDDRRLLFMAGLGILGGMQAHGLTDQVVTTNVGTLLVLLSLAAVVAGLRPPALERLVRWLRRGVSALVVMAVVGLALLFVLPAGRAQVLLDIGGLQLNRSLRSLERANQLQHAQTTFEAALALDPGHPAVLRNLARVRSLLFDDSGSLDALQRAAGSPRLDAFDRLQIAQLYRDAGFAQDAYSWAAEAYALWGRSTEDVVMRSYAENTLRDDEGGHRARTLAQQAEAAMAGRAFGQAEQLFQQALTFAPDNAYLQYRVGAAQRAVAKYGEGTPRELE